MTNKTKAANATKNVCQIEGQPNLTRSEILADIAVAGVLAGAITTQSFSNGNYGQIDLTRAVHALQMQVDASRQGQSIVADNLLVSQAVTLNAIFHDCCRRGLLNMGEYPDAAERYMRLALKAQSQCRATLEGLAAIKNPPTVFAKQANVAHGPQQINNGAHNRLPHGKLENEQSKLLENIDDKWLDNRTARTPSISDTGMETVGSLDRPANIVRQSDR